jgi:isocitrate dehydrogenase
MSDFIPITVAYGDGIGPEITEATIKILKEAEVPIRIESIEVGEKLYEKDIPQVFLRAHGNLYLEPRFY